MFAEEQRKAFPTPLPMLPITNAAGLPPEEQVEEAVAAVVLPTVLRVWRRR